LLASQGLTLRGNHGSHNSSNRGNFIEFIQAFGRCNIEIANGFLNNAPRNAMYIASSIQKEILHIFANKVRKLIYEEVENRKFCIIIDEAIEVANREQMAIILRYIDYFGFIREIFFDIVSVIGITTLTLKNRISNVLSQHRLLVENLCGKKYVVLANYMVHVIGYKHCFCNHMHIMCIGSLIAYN